MKRRVKVPVPPSEGITIVEVLNPGETRPATVVFNGSLDEAFSVVRGWP